MFSMFLTINKDCSPEQHPAVGISKRTKCVYCEVGTELLNVVYMNSSLKELRNVLFSVVDVRVPG